MITSINEFKKYLNESLECGKLNRYIYHTANPINRKLIDEIGIMPFRGDQWLSDTEIEGNAVFATNSNNPKDWFDSTWDDDVWRIDTSKIPNIKWKPDSNTESELCKYDGKWIYTQQPIPRNAIELIKIGTGKDIIDESVNNNFSSFKNELINIEKNRDFKSWLKQRGYSEDKIARFKKYDAINALCGELAAYLHYKYKVKVYYIETPEISDGHQFVKYDDLYYDAMNPNGVKTPGDLFWSKQYSKQISKEKINTKVKQLRNFEDFDDAAETFGWVKYDDKSGTYKLVESVDTERIWTGKEVNQHIKDITPSVHDVPDYYMDKLIKHRNFKIQQIDLNNLLATDPSFKEYYDSGESRYEDATEEDDHMPHPDDIDYEIVVVDGELLDGYNRVSSLLRMGEKTTYGFLAI